MTIQKHGGKPRSNDRRDVRRNVEFARVEKRDSDAMLEIEENNHVKMELKFEGDDRKGSAVSV